MDLLVIFIYIYIHIYIFLPFLFLEIESLKFYFFLKCGGYISNLCSFPSIACRKLNETLFYWLTWRWLEETFPKKKKENTNLFSFQWNCILLNFTWRCLDCLLYYQNLSWEFTGEFSIPLFSPFCSLSSLHCSIDSIEAFGDSKKRYTYTKKEGKQVVGKDGWERSGLTGGSDGTRAIRMYSGIRRVSTRAISCWIINRVS